MSVVRIRTRGVCKSVCINDESMCYICALREAFVHFTTPQLRMSVSASVSLAKLNHTPPLSLAFPLFGFAFRSVYFTKSKLIQLPFRHSPRRNASPIDRSKTRAETLYLISARISTRIRAMELIKRLRIERCEIIKFINCCWMCRACGSCRAHAESWRKA